MENEDVLESIRQLSVYTARGDVQLTIRRHADNVKKNPDHTWTVSLAHDDGVGDFKEILLVGHGPYLIDAIDDVMRQAVG